MKSTTLKVVVIALKKDSSKGKNDVNRLPKRHVNSMTMPLTIRKEGLVKAMV